MKINLIQSLWVVCAFCVSTFLSAQDNLPSIYLENQETEVGQIIDVDILVSNYENIISTAFTLNWDASKLRYVELDNIELGLTEDDSFNQTDAAQGILTYLYFDMTLAGNSQEDEGALFTVRFEVIGGDATSTDIAFGGLLEVVNTNEEALTSEFQNATITIGDVTSTEQVNREKMGVEVSPNPFSISPNLSINTSLAGEASWSLMGVDGQQIKTGTIQLLQGKNTFSLNNSLFKSSGSYTFTLQMEDMVLNKRLIFIEP